MDQECKIVDEDETSNFRRFKPEDLEKKYSPFERIQKKEFPFLFQKKHIPKENTKTSLEDIINKMRDLSCNSPTFKPIHALDTPFPYLLPLTPISDSRTPLYRALTPPYPLSIDDHIMEIPELNLDEDLIFISTCMQPITDLNIIDGIMKDGNK